MYLRNRFKFWRFLIQTWCSPVHHIYKIYYSHRQLRTQLSTASTIKYPIDWYWLAVSSSNFPFPSFIRFLFRTSLLIKSPFPSPVATIHHIPTIHCVKCLRFQVANFTIKNEWLAKINLI